MYIYIAKKNCGVSEKYVLVCMIGLSKMCHNYYMKVTYSAWNPFYSGHPRGTTFWLLYRGGLYSGVVVRGDPL